MCLPVFFVSTGDDDGPRPDGVVDPSTPAVAEGDMLEVANQRPAIDVYSGWLDNSGFFRGVVVGRDADREQGVWPKSIWFAACH